MRSKLEADIIGIKMAAKELACLKIIVMVILF